MGKEMKKSCGFYRAISALFILFGVSMLASCGSGSGTGDVDCDPLTPNFCSDDSGNGSGIAPTCDSNEAGIVDGCGEAITALDRLDPVIVNLQGLAANAAHSVTITDSSQPAIDISTLPEHAAGSSALTSDKDGNIFMATIVQNMTAAAALGEYTVTVSDSVPTVVQTFNYNIENRNRVLCTDDLQAAKASFTSAESVFATVTGTLGNGSYDVYVISDAQTAIPNGGPIPGTAVQIAVSGGTGTLDLGTFASGTAHDVLVDVDGDGFYDRDSDLISRHARYHPCFVIQDANSEASDQIVADQLGNKREIFDPDADKVAIRDVFASLTPAQTSANTAPVTADIYIVTHQDTWSDGDPLADLSGSAPPGVNNGPVQNNANTMGNLLQWSFSNLAAGCYDVVVDIDQDGGYTAGTDYYDNVNHLGDSSDCGFRVSVSDSTDVTISSHVDEELTTATAIEMSGTVNESGGRTLVAAYIRVTSGTQTNIISLDSLASSGGGTYTDVQVPLFSGANYITVSGVYDDDSSRSETIEIFSVNDEALFRAQLTWDGSTDMDLHLVRPGGSYSNGGGGSDDCNYSNCAVGLDGTGINSIDWGTPDLEDDDPKLDVDCVSCGNGIENIWMSEINETGSYSVYVDAFSGNEDDSDVIVTISILGSTVGQVNCGSMASGTSTDSCHVGDINWTGSVGSFTAIGDLAEDF
jgi:hypothetical protein